MIIHNSLKGLLVLITIPTLSFVAGDNDLPGVNKAYYGIICEAMNEALVQKQGNSNNINADQISQSIQVRFFFIIILKIKNHCLTQFMYICDRLIDLRPDF